MQQTLQKTPGYFGLSLRATQHVAKEITTAFNEEYDTFMIIQQSQPQSQQQAAALNTASTESTNIAMIQSTLTATG